MSILLVGKVDYLNCFPIYYPIESDLINLPIELVKGPPALLNRKYLEGHLTITPISSIEYAKNPNSSLILPNMSISAVGNVESILLFSKVPIEKLNNKNIALTNSSATSIVLLKILLSKMFGILPNYETMTPNLAHMLERADAALLIGDDALSANTVHNSELYIYDLGKLWFDLTGLPMVYAVWVIRQEIAKNYANETAAIVEGFQQAKIWYSHNLDLIIKQANENYDYSVELITNYFSTIKYELDTNYQKSLSKFYSYAEELGIISTNVDLKIWG
ncbi:MAG: menaquinone biosynthesis protein [Bacillota bacterium]|nr:menaquinone biosynthesis protein [Bacillota bacterium]